MKDWKWPSVIVFIAMLAAIVTMFGLTDDAAERAHLIGYLDTLVPFVVGGATGATVGALAGYARARGVI